MNDHAKVGEVGESRVAAMEAELRAALAERNALWASAQRTRSLELELEHARAIIDDMQQSVSWRLTTPLRGAKGQAQAKKKAAGRVRRALRGS